MLIIHSVEMTKTNSNAIEFESYSQAIPSLAVSATTGLNMRAYTQSLRNLGNS